MATECYFCKKPLYQDTSEGTSGVCWQCKRSTNRRINSLKATDTRMVKIKIGTFEMDVKQSFLEYSANKHFWSVIGKAIKQEEKKNGTNKKSNRAKTRRPGSSHTQLQGREDTGGQL